MTTPTVPPFDLAGPLPTGLTVLEASAGTGKTWAISALAIRYLADGLVTAPHLLAITYTHLAGADLRARLFQRLQDVVRLTASRLDGRPDTPDALVDVICSGPDDEAAARLSRLHQAVGDFDSATVATIHEFCQRAGEWLGPSAGMGRTGVDEEAAAALAAQTVADQTLVQQLRRDNQLSAQQCAALGRSALANPWLPIVPGDDQAGLFARGCRTEYARRKAALGADDFTDMARRLDQSLGSTTLGATAAEALCSRFHVVLVDEFQDTDPVQWSILRQAFHGRRPLVLVGDPKQSIYGFRGADVHAYLEAVTQADATYTLPVNYRSDKPVVQAINQVFSGTDFGLDAAPIPMRESTAWHEEARLDHAGLEIRRLPVNAGRSALADDVVAWVAGLLSSHPRLCVDGRWRQLRADDIAVLVSYNQRGEQLSGRLRQAGVPAVFSGTASVFGSLAAEEWLLLLDALAHPRPDTIRRAMAGRLVGLSLTQLASPDDAATAHWAARLREWSGDGLGPADVLQRLDDSAGLSSRLLAAPDGERLLTDVRHLAELLQARADGAVDAAGLQTWLRAQYRRAVDSGGGDKTRRLETDRPAVSVLTIHAAKGLEFPVVLVPATADAPRQTWAGTDYPMIWREAGHQMIDTRTGGEGQAVRYRAWADEQSAEDRRKLYVALTRASSLVVTWVGRRQSTFSGLVADWGVDDSRPGVRLVAVPQSVAPPQLPPASQPPILGANMFQRRIDAYWTRTSYSGLTSGLHGAASEPSDLADEPDTGGDETRTPSPGDDSPLSPMDALPAGAAFGTIVHGVLQDCDPASPTLHHDLVEAAVSWRDRSVLPDLDVDALASALELVSHTPIAGATSLADIGARRRLAELTFEMPLGDGDRRHSLAELAALFDDPALVPADDPLLGYGAQLAGSAAAPRLLAGFLTGSIDAVMELPDGRLLLIDYKTNRLGPSGGPDLVSCYSRPAMAAAMCQAHYPLQALLYAVALRRYLAWRRPDQSFDDQWAGVAYLFVRGMAGPGTPVDGGWPTGVFGWRPSPELIARADEVLRGGDAQ